MRKDIKEIFMYVLAALMVVSILTIVAILIYVELPTANKDMLYMVIGALISAFTTVISFFFGSSKSSADKTEIMKNQSENK